MLTVANYGPCSTKLRPTSAECGRSSTKSGAVWNKFGPISTETSGGRPGFAQNRPHSGRPHSVSFFSEFGVGRFPQRSWTHIAQPHFLCRSWPVPRTSRRQNNLMSKLQANVDNKKKNAGDNDAARAAAQQEEMDRHFFEAENVKQNRLKQMRLENQALMGFCAYATLLGNRSWNEGRGNSRKADQLRSKSPTLVESGSLFGRTRSNSVELEPNMINYESFDRHRRNLTQHGKLRLISTEFGPNSGQICPDFNRCSTGLGQLQPNLARKGIIFADTGRNLARRGRNH